MKLTSARATSTRRGKRNMPVTFRLLSLSALPSLCSSFFLSGPTMPELKICCILLPSSARWAQPATVAIQICDSLCSV
ncbi:unnamed protein product [Ixodes pacificus]